VKFILDNVLPVSPILAEMDRMVPQANAYIEKERAP